MSDDHDDYDALAAAAVALWSAGGRGIGDLGPGTGGTGVWAWVGWILVVFVVFIGGVFWTAAQPSYRALVQDADRATVVVPMTEREYAGLAAERVLSELERVDPGRVVLGNGSDEPHEFNTRLATRKRKAPSSTDVDSTKLMIAQRLGQVGRRSARDDDGDDRPFQCALLEGFDLKAHPIRLRRGLRAAGDAGEVDGALGGGPGVVAPVGGHVNRRPSGSL